MRDTRAVAVMIAVAMASGCVVPPRMSTQPPIAIEEYRIGAPDKLKITVRPEPEIEREAVVRPDGRIAFDLIGELVAEGRTVEAVRREISNRIQEFIVNPDVTVTLMESNSRRYYVIGEVNRIGAYPLVGHVTAVEGLAMAQGATRLGASNLAWLTRTQGDGPAAYPIRFRDISERADVTTNYELQPGDVIYIPPNVSAQLGYAVQLLFFPLQQILGLGGNLLLRTVTR